MNLLSKLLLTILSICLVIFIAVIGFNVISANQLAVDNANLIAESEAEKYAKSIEAELNYTMDIVRTLAMSIEVLKREGHTDRAHVHAMLKKVLEENDQYVGVWTAWEPDAFDGLDAEFINEEAHDETGRFVPYLSRDGNRITTVVLEDYDVPGLGDYYLIARNSGRETIIEPYQYVTADGQNILMTSLSVPIVIDGQTAGVVGIDISLDYLQDINKQIALYDSGFGAIISHQGMIVAHAMDSLIGTSNYEIDGITVINEIRTAVENGQPLTVIDYSPVTQNDVYKVYSPIRAGESTTPWSMMVTIPIDEVNKESRELMVNAIIIAIIGFLILTAGIIWITRNLVRPITQIAEQIQEVEHGNLAVSPLTIKTKDELGKLADSINSMVAGLRKTVNGILTSAESVAAASQEISASTEEIASGSSDQANSAQMMNQMFNELLQATNSVAAGATEASELSGRTVNIALEGEKVVHESVEGMNAVSEQMTLLEEDSNEIGNIIEVIDEIAEQTNLLALNAAIEAARAGEQGRGFAVVADEVRKLAERSGEATQQITNIIKGMQNNTGLSVQSVAQAVAKTAEINQAFENIISMVNESASKVDEIAAASEEQTAQSNEVLQSIETISAASEEAAAAAEETASTTQSLAKLAEELTDSVAAFKLN